MLGQVFVVRLISATDAAPPTFSTMLLSVNCNITQCFSMSSSCLFEHCHNKALCRSSSTFSVRLLGVGHFRLETSPKHCPFQQSPSTIPAPLLQCVFSAGNRENVLVHPYWSGGLSWGDCRRGQMSEEMCPSIATGRRYAWTQFFRHLPPPDGQ